MIRKLRSYINEQNEYMTNKVIDFLRTHSKMTSRKFRSIESFLLNIAKFKDTNYNVITYLRNTIRNLSRVFPNIILNKVDNSNITIPRHWKLSKTHNKDIQNRIEKYYSYLSSLYDDAEMNNIATKIQPKKFINIYKCKSYSNFNKIYLISRKLVFGENCFHWAFWLT